MADKRKPPTPRNTVETSVERDEVMALFSEMIADQN
jgi:hypothetical protein